MSAPVQLFSKCSALFKGSSLGSLKFVLAFSSTAMWSIAKNRCYLASDALMPEAWAMQTLLWVSDSCPRSSPSIWLWICTWGIVCCEWGGRVLLWMCTYALLADTEWKDSSITEYLCELEFPVAGWPLCWWCKIDFKMYTGNFQLKWLFAAFEAAGKA